MRTLLWGALLLCAWPAVPQEAAGLVDEQGRAPQQLSVAENHFLRGEDWKALESYRKAREHFLAIGDQLGQGDAWRGEAQVLLRLGEKKEALEAFETARQLLRAARQHFLATGDQLRQGNTWYGEAEILYRLGEKDTQALYSYGRARQLYVAVGSKPGEGNAWRGEANVLLRLRKDQEAIDSYRKARQLFMAIGDHEGQGDAWIGEALAWISLSKDPVTQRHNSFPRLRKAIKAAAAAVTQYQHAGDISRQIGALLIQAKAEVAEEETRVAASNAMLRNSAINIGNLGALSVGVSLQLKATGKSATRPLEEAIRRHGSWRETGTTDGDRIAREEIIREAYDFLVTLRARQKGQEAEALQLAEKARSRVLLDLLAAPPAFTPQPELESSAAQRASFPQETPLDVGPIQDLARETGPLLVYYTTESEVWGFLILPGTAKIDVRSITLSRSELEKEIHDLRYRLVNLSKLDAESHSYRLWDLLIRPFLTTLPKSGPLVVVPHGPLHELPFESLRDAEGKRLFERWQISITPSVSALAIARGRHEAPLPGDSFLGFYSGRGLALPEAEVAKIFGFFGTGKTRVANYQNYRESVSQAHHLLISTRGVYTKESRTETYLEIESTPDHDSRLTAAEIAAIPLQAELVTLAACDTSYGQPLMSDERLDLTRSFLIAGATAVLASRWKVPESEATSQFLADFYQAYRQGGPQGTGLRKDEALTEARRRSRERRDPAQVWAGWVLIGDPR